MDQLIFLNTPTKMTQHQLKAVCDKVYGQIPAFNNSQDISQVYDDNFQVFHSVDPLKESKCFYDDHEVAFWLGVGRVPSGGNWVNLYQRNETVDIDDIVGGHDCIYMQGDFY